MAVEFETMTSISPQSTLPELLKIANDNHLGLINLPDEEKATLIACIKELGQLELEYGEETLFEKVRVVRRVTGAVSIFFEKDEPEAKPKAKAKPKASSEPKEK